MTDTQTPVMPLPLTAAAVSYLQELEGAAELAQIEFVEAQAVDRRTFLLGLGRPRSTSGPGCAMNAPGNVAHGRIMEAAQERRRAAQRGVAYVAWWWAAAAIAALEQRAAGIEVTARRLEQATLHLPNDRKEELERSGWRRPVLPAVGQYDTGRANLDERMNRALAELHSAYSAASLAEAMDDDEEDLQDWQGSAYHDAARHANRIPELLMDYARLASDAATGRN